MSLMASAQHPPIPDNSNIIIPAPTKCTPLEALYITYIHIYMCVHEHVGKEKER